MVHTSEKKPATELPVVAVASKAVRYYAQGIIKAEILTAQMHMALATQAQTDRQQALTHLWRIARRVCGNELYQACLSSDPAMREQAFNALRIYIEYVLARAGYAQAFSQLEMSHEDVVQQILETLFALLARGKKHGPDEPAAFLRWITVIVCRQAGAILKKIQREQHLSLDEQADQHDEHTGIHMYDTMIVDDPLRYVLQAERSATVRDAINSLHNPQHRIVLCALYLVGMDAPELAQKLHVSVQVVHQWKHRAIKQLQKHPLLQDLR